MQVHNLRIADHHTYFVGDHDWGFSVWAHNSCSKTIFQQSNWTWEQPSISSPISSDLPLFNGDQTNGVFQANGEYAWLVSGYKGPGQLLSQVGSDLSWVDKIALTHVEGHAAAIMVENGLQEGFLTINNPRGPCNFCQSAIGSLLPPGDKLWVSYPAPNGNVGLGFFLGVRMDFLECNGL